MASVPAQPAAAKPAHRNRATPLHARGEPMVWLTGTALVLCICMILGLLGLVLYSGAATFWPKQINRITYTPDGSTPRTALGIEIDRESYEPSEADRAAIAKLQQAGKLPEGSLDSKGKPNRRLFRVGNREVRDQPFVWIPVYQISEITQPASAAMLERTEWGPWFGEPAGVVIVQQRQVDGPADKLIATEKVQDELGTAKVDRKLIKPLDGGKLLIEERRTIGAGDPAATMAAFNKLWPAALARVAAVEHLNRGEVGAINHQIDELRIELRQAEIELARAKDAQAGKIPLAPVWVWYVSLIALVGSMAGVVALKAPKAERGKIVIVHPARVATRACLVAIAISMAIFAWVERPGSLARATETQVKDLTDALAKTRERAAADRVKLEKAYADIKESTAKIEAEDKQYRVLFVEPTTGKFAPMRKSELDEPLMISQIVRAIQPNEMSSIAKMGVYLSRWSEFIFGEPREANTEGGIFPVIFGTVLLTILLSVLVVPLGVIAAIYLREYAKQGPLTSTIRIAINNLAGVPSIVYGVFGLGFFCYTVGAYFDTGSGIRLADKVRVFGFGPTMFSAVAWWLAVGMLVFLTAGTIYIGLASKPRPGQHATGTQEWMARAAAWAWVAVALLIGLLFATTPYFSGFFEAYQPSPKFAAKGMLWSALTLALLTLPVVIVATEEAIASVPRSMREGSYGCGASKWQTIQRIVLPRAMPGIMTGMILAMARGAGEVAPLMLVGAVKLAPELALNSHWPFIHLDQSFMHLGFHIYDVGFQSPDSEAAKPVVWCTTFLLIVVVVTLNAAAITVRSSLRKKFHGETF